MKDPKRIRNDIGPGRVLGEAIGVADDAPPKVHKIEQKSQIRKDLLTECDAEAKKPEPVIEEAALETMRAAPATPGKGGKNKDKDEGKCSDKGKGKGKVCQGQSQGQRQEQQRWQQGVAEHE
eukprot:8572879-Pyramimonas_sp.AAC.1